MFRRRRSSSFNLYHIIMSPTHIHHEFLLSLGLFPSSPMNEWPFTQLQEPTIEKYIQSFERWIKGTRGHCQTGFVSHLGQKKLTVVRKLQNEYVEAVVYLNKDDYRRGKNEVRIVFDRPIDATRMPTLIHLLSNSNA